MARRLAADRGALTGTGDWIRQRVGTAAWRLKSAVAATPTLALPLARLRGHGELVARDSDILIEAFVRSGLSFAVAAFRLAQEPRAVKVAHHTHAPAAVIQAVRVGVPSLVIVRNPMDAICSYVIKTPDVSLAAGLHGYIRFHRALLPYRDRVAIGTFEELVQDFGKLTVRVNERFNTSFVPFEPTPDNVRRIFTEIENDWSTRGRDDEERERGVPRPSKLRDALKEQLLAQYRSPALGAPRARAERLYTVLAAGASS